MTYQYQSRSRIFGRVLGLTLAGITLFVGVLFCLLLFPVFGAFTLFSTKDIGTFPVVFVYTAVIGLPLSIVFGFVLGLVNGVLTLLLAQQPSLTILLAQQPSTEAFQAYGNTLRRIAISVGVIAPFLLLGLLGADVMNVVPPGWLFIILFIAITVYANHWAMMRYLNWYKINYVR